MSEEAGTSIESVEIKSAKRINEIIAKVSVPEEEFHKQTQEFIDLLSTQLKEAGYTDEDLSDEKLDEAARMIFLEPNPLTEKGKNDLERVKASYPKLAEIAETDKTTIENIHKKRGEILKLKQQYEPELDMLLAEEYSFIISHIDYNLGLDSEASNFEFVGDINSLTEINIKPGEPSDDYSFDRKARAQERVQNKIDKYQKILKVNENIKPSDKESLADKKTIASVVKITKQIDFHNDLEGISRTRDYVKTPKHIKFISRLPKSPSSTLSITRIAENPYLQAELAKRVKEETAELNLKKRITWKDKIDPEVIYSIIEKVDTQSAHLDKTARKDVVAEIFNRYQKLFGVTPDNRGATPEDLRYDSLIADTIKEIAGESLPMMPIDRRVLNSQMLALHYLFTSNGIDRIYENYLKSIPPNDAPTNKQNEWKVKSVLAMDFLRRNAKKNKENGIERKNPEAPTVGIEYEYTDRLEGLILPDSETNRYIEEVKKSLEKAKKEGTPTEGLEEFLRQLENVKAQLLTNSNRVLFDENDSNLDLIRRFEIAALLINDPSITQINTKFGTFKEDLEHSPGYREIITEPSISYRMQMREIVQTMARGALNTELNPHFTIGNVELSLDRPEASELRILVMAAGWVDSDEIVPDNDYIRGEEHFWKLTTFGDKKYYLPFHYVREFRDMSLYNTKYSPQGFEIRTFTHGTSNKKNFPNHIRTLAFLSSSAFGLQASQKDEVIRNTKEQKLANLWGSLMSEWKSLLSESGVDFLPFDKRYAEVEIDYADDKVALKYLDSETKDSYRKYMAMVLKASQQDPKFKNRVREIISTYRRKANKLIGY